MEQPKITVYGGPWCPDWRQSKQFLSEQHVRYNWVDIDEGEEGRKRVQELNDCKQIIPTIIFEDGSILVEPSNPALVAKWGISPKSKREYYDLVIVVSSPAGLTTDLYAALLDPLSGGIQGQAGITERIDNYPGFVAGIGGNELADQKKANAVRFDVEILPAQAVTQIQTDGDYKSIST